MLDPSIDASLHAYITYVILGFACSNLYVCVYMSHACMDLHVFGYVYTWNNDSHAEYVWMWFSTPWCLVLWFAYLPLCVCYVMSPRVLIDWWLHEPSWNSHVCLGQYVYFIVFDCNLFDMLCLYHFPLDIYIFLINIFLWIYIWVLMSSS